MNDAVTSWIELTWAALAPIPGAAEVVEQERRRWEAFRGLGTLEVVVFGAYDAGKSSLLKRLLVDWQVPVPEWLTVSGRRETFESKRVEAMGFGLTDTPGLGSGNDEHDNLTLSAMRLADAYLWVLPPQLVTTGKDRFIEVLFGNVGIADATIATVARMDEAGVDPSDNEQEFIDLCERKKTELSSIIAEAPCVRQLRSIHCVVADPYQMVGNLPNPGPEAYGFSRNWDGMDEISREMLDLRQQRRELRSRAGCRFIQLLVGDVRGELRGIEEELTLSKEGMDNEAKRYDMYEQRLNALQRQALAELHRRLEDALLSASRSAGAVGAESIVNLEEMLSKLIDDWAEESSAAYSQLVAELELDATERMKRPCMDGLRRLAQEADGPEGSAVRPGFDPLKTGIKAMAFGPALRQSFEKYATFELGMTMKEAAKRLDDLASSGKTIEDYIKSKGKDAAFRSIEHAEKASKFVKWTRALDVAGPLVEQIGGVLFEVANEFMTARQAEEKAQRRVFLRQQLQTEAGNIEKEAATLFNAHCDGLRHWIGERDAIFRQAVSKLDEQLGNIRGGLMRLDELLETCPKP